MTKISLIAAMAKDRVIGKDNDMPWHLPADLKHFKKVTLGKPVIMGRRTFESIGRPLPGRKNIVITRNQQWTHEGVEVVSSTELAMSLVAGVDEVMIIGGGKIYEQFLPQADILYLTFIDLDVDGDTRFPDWTTIGAWQQVESESHKPDEKNSLAYEFVRFDKK
ncbi:type 3 dihydrofolate reductase [Psychrosphaera sp. F3M07]|uniref:type 3 dihydrofolate reductase n=1 Tax=Psychrosphaera sp. F3M07 TaxID=2841560 RepID=UPI001C097071|nr:type 3 dihydrofolate reductase [Psychrosphaera sp. F3M07]MBU2916716.1 type 3 dihydrofolate reductase [Psychrosphaera sp. F3M07]